MRQEEKEKEAYGDQLFDIQVELIISLLFHYYLTVEHSIYSSIGIYVENVI